MKIIKYIIFLSFLTNGLLCNASSFKEVVDLSGYWKFRIGDDMNWASPDYDDRSWDELIVPAAWENEGFHGYDGYAWYRVNFQVNKNPDEAYYIELGYIDDVDEVYINGELVGFNGSFPPRFRTAYNSFRRYYIPTDIIEDGINTVAVRIYDTVLDGGIIKGDPAILINKSKTENTYLLEGIWKFANEQDDRYRVPGYDDSSWEQVIVPHFWHSFKKYTVSQFATYRKEFTLPDYLKDEQELVIVLGKIDDFDRVYLNGKLIGFTKDNRPLGQSESWQQYRIYGLFNSSLNREGKNIITVEVEDIGINAGIYEGPIGITTAEYFKKFIRNFD